ncbi:MAG: polysaccharide deacetylase family protein [Chitinophagia bacterium]|nr:polysaccharide deacetylase family protein [Chitinophagia bacterium]
MNLPVVVPRWLRMLYPNRTWSLPVAEKILYLSFDDGPHPTITPKVLALLKQYNAKATFFCLGKNVEKYPDVFKSIQVAGHSIGNHSFHHLNGWKSNNQIYIDDVTKASSLIHSNLFRPPYGRLKFSQASALREKGYELIMWTVLSADYDQHITKEQCAMRVVENIKPGAIVLFHDSEKAEGRMLYALEELLKDATKKGLRFEAIEYQKGSA